MKTLFLSLIIGLTFLSLNCELQDNNSNDSEYLTTVIYNITSTSTITNIPIQIVYTYSNIYYTISTQTPIILSQTRFIGLNNPYFYSVKVSPNDSSLVQDIKIKILENNNLINQITNSTSIPIIIEGYLPQ
jgi:hypothetical protein